MNRKPSLNSLTLLALTLCFGAWSSAGAQTLQHNPGYTQIGAGLSGAYPFRALQSPAAWANFNNDFASGRPLHDIIYAGRNFVGVPQTFLYKQNADGTFTSVATNLPGVEYGLFLWADINGDDFPDLFFAGEDGVGDNVTGIYRNEAGTGNFTRLGAVIPGIYYGHGAAWGDYDGDNDPDLLVMSTSGSDIYRNDAGTFTAIGAGFPARNGSAAFGDYDADGDLDIAMSSEGAFDPYFTIYNNNGGVFSDSGITIPPKLNGYVLWGDFEGDGDLDLLFRGITPGDITAYGYVYLNNGSGSFTLYASSIPTYEGWYDVDGDGDLDLHSPGSVTINEWPEPTNFNASSTLYGAGDFNYGTSVWADYDEDGDADYFYAATDNSGFGFAYSEIVQFHPVIWGFVTTGEPDYTAIPGVTIDGGVLGTQITDADGWYVFDSVPNHSTYSLTASLSGYRFTPAARTGTLYSTAQADFVPGYDISGRVSLNGSGLAGVQVSAGSIGTATTDAQGEFSFINVAGAAYTLTPSKVGVSFTPASIDVTLSVDEENIAFTADACPSDPLKVVPGNCGCGSTELNTDTDTDGTWDCVDSDDDNDGSADSQETLDGTDPLDRGSRMLRLDTTACSEWNGFLGMWNILEHANRTSGQLSMRSIAYTPSNAPGQARPFSIAGYGQQDVLVHDLNGWSSNSVGRVCSQITSGQGEGSFDGRMVYYRPANSPTAERPYDFVAAIPLDNGIQGEQWLTFNTYQPSLNVEHGNDFVANWMEIRNLEATAQAGTLSVYDMGGRLLEARELSFTGLERKNIALHELSEAHGLSRRVVGTLSWTPESAFAKFHLRNARYYYDNPFLSDSFRGAASVESVVGTRRPLAAPLHASDGSAVLEILNTTATEQTVRVTIYDILGNETVRLVVPIPGYGSRHVVTDAHLPSSGATAPFLDRQGLALIQGESAIAVVGMHYGRTPDLSLTYAFSQQVAEATGLVLEGSYNTFLGQACAVLIGNVSDETARGSLRLVRLNGSTVVTMPIFLPAHTSTAAYPCMGEEPNQYGTVVLEGEDAGKFAATLLRTGPGYQFPVTIRP